MGVIRLGRKVLSGIRGPGISALDDVGGEFRDGVAPSPLTVQPDVYSYGA
jgi:hypothetical protein